MKSIKFFVLVLACVTALSVCVFALDSERDFTFEEGLAKDLKALGLFSGVSENDFDLERVPTRTEVLVMLIRVLGEEKAALEGEWEHPFTDVPAWADKYVGYAYEKGLTKGVSATKFGTDNANSTTYLTFMLRALGYSDAKGDFAWDAPHTLARGLGMLPSAVDTENFLRADIVTVSYAALYVNLKDTTTMLAEKLIEKEVFTAEVYGNNYRATKLTDKENDGKAVLTDEQIFEKCSPAVVCINAYDEDGELWFNGSGFFIDESGIGITTYYVIDGASRLESVTVDGVKHEITGIYDFSGRYDWVVFKVDGDNFATLPFNPMPVKGASTVYAIGSPEGLDNTVSAGIVSNVRRVMYDDYAYIQTTAPISDGSFGGPLVNSYGEAVGVIHDFDYEGQNINFALPVSAFATADLSKATPYAEFDWNSLWYYIDEDEIELKVGEAIDFEYSYYYTLADYDEFPEIKVASSDNTVASAVRGDSYYTVRITGNKAGKTEFVLSNTITDDIYTVSVTVVENPELTGPKVIYKSDVSEIKLYEGAYKWAIIDIVEYGITDTPDGTLAAEYTVTCSNKNINIITDFADDNFPHVAIRAQSSKKVSGEITVSNNKTGDTIVIPVIVGNRYATAFEELVTFVKEEGVAVEDGYIATVTKDGDVAVFNYYPDSEKVTACIFGASKEVSGEVTLTFTFTKDEKTNFEIAMTAYGININCTGRVKSPKDFWAKEEQIVFDTFECPGSVKDSIKPTMAYLAIAYIMTLDSEILPLVSPNLDMSDFGYINVDPNMPL